MKQKPKIILNNIPGIQKADITLNSIGDCVFLLEVFTEDQSIADSLRLGMYSQLEDGVIFYWHCPHYQVVEEDTLNFGQTMIEVSGLPKVSLSVYSKDDESGVYSFTRTHIRDNCLSILIYPCSACSNAWESVNCELKRTNETWEVPYAES